MGQQNVESILFQPIQINKLNVANRIVMGPMAAASPSENGEPSAQTIAFFEARAKGGVGLIIMGGSIATKRGYEEAMLRPLLRLDIDDTIEGFRKLTQAVHRHGVPIIAQLTAGFGRMGVSGPNRPLISASPLNVVIPEKNFPKGIYVPGGRVTQTPQEATIAEIQQYEKETIEAAQRAQRAGFDGIELAAHMNYFIASFLAPRTNWRSDEYGGPPENRARMLVNMARAIRAACGPDFVIGLRTVANDFLPDGQDARGYLEVTKVVAAAGLDYVALSDGVYETMHLNARAEDGGMMENGDARVFKQALSIPILVQGIHDPARAARAVAQGDGDLIMLARPMLADPDFAQKLRAGHGQDIVICDRANSCMRRMVFGMPVRCSANPNMGRESRTQGDRRPPQRWLKAPIEWAIMKLTGSKTLMGMISKMLAKKAA